MIGMVVPLAPIVPEAEAPCLLSCRSRVTWSPEEFTLPLTCTAVPCATAALNAVRRAASARPALEAVAALAVEAAGVADPGAAAVPGLAELEQPVTATRPSAAAVERATICR